MQSGEKGLGQRGDKELDGHSDRVPEFLCGDGKTFQKNNNFCSPSPIRPSMVEWSDGSHSSVKGIDSSNGLSDHENKIFGSDESKIELKRHIWRKPGAIPTVKQGCGSIMM